MSALVVARPTSSWRVAGTAALASMLTMPLTAMWFLLLGGILIVGSLAVAAVREAPRLGPAAFAGLGLLAGPAIYLGLAVLQ